MSRKLLAALCAVLTFAAALAVVPLTAGTAEAHTKTVRKCAFDPFAGQQCWNEAVRHYHTPVQRNIPTPKPKPPASCPAGTTGTPPNCYPTDHGNGSTNKPKPKDSAPDGDGTPDSSGTPDGDGTPDSSGTPDGDGTPDSSGTPDGDGTSDGSGTSDSSGTPDDDKKKCLSGSFVSGDCTPRGSAKPSTSKSTPGECPSGQVDPDGNGCRGYEVFGEESAALVARLQALLKGIEDRGLELQPIPDDPQQSGFPWISRGTLASLAVAGFGRALVCAPATLAGGIGGGVCFVLVAGTSIAVGEIVANADQEDDSSQGDGSGSGDDTTPADSTPDGDSTPREGGTAAARPTPDSTPDATTPQQTPQEAWNDAMSKYVNGKLNRAGLQAAADAYQCAQGVQSKCK